MIFSKPPVVLLLGPTASGKTERAFQWVQGQGDAPFESLEIISMDSAMVYRGMDIGTGKPTPEELRSTPHHLIDIRNPTEPYSVAEFRRDALSLMANIVARGKIPLLVGGTMLYVRALLQGLSPLPSANINIRTRLLQEAQAYGWPYMHQRLTTIDPMAALRIHPNDPQRIQRALEVYEITGKSMTCLLSVVDNTDIHAYDIHIFSLGKEMLDPLGRGILHDKIAKRFHQMLEQGLIEEVKGLFEQLKDVSNYSDLPAMRAVGYRQVCQYMRRELSYPEMVEKAIAATRQLAKRQLTALRNLKNVNWLT